MVGKIRKQKNILDNPEETRKFSTVSDKLQDTDPLDVQLKIIDIGEKFDLKKETLDAIDSAETTGQYIKLMNKTLDKRLKKIKQMKFEDTFSKEKKANIDSKKFSKLNSKPIEDLEIQEISDLLNYWKSVHKNTRNKFDEITNHLNKFSNEMKMQEKIIGDLQKEFEDKKLQEKNQINKNQQKNIERPQTIQMFQKELLQYENCNQEDVSAAIEAFKTSLKLGGKK